MENVERLTIYNSRKLDINQMWILFLFLGWSYGSMNQIGKQIFYYLTFGGFGLWTLYRLFTLSSKVKTYNKIIAQEIGMTISEMMLLGIL